MHNFPRLNYETNALSTDNNFALTTNLDDVSLDTTNLALKNYIIGLITLPALWVIVGVASIILFQLFLTCRCLCRCLKCAPNEDDIVSSPEKVIKSRNRMVWGFKLFLLLLAAGDVLLYIGNGSFQTGTGNVIKSANLLKTIFKGLIVETQAMVANLSILQTQTQLIATGNCGGSTTNGSGGNFPPQITSSIDAMSLAFSTILKLVENVPKLLDSIIDLSDKYGNTYRELGLYILAGFVILISLIFYVGYACASKMFLFFGVFVGEVVCLMGTIFGGVFLIVLSMYADLCVDPAKNLGVFAPDSTKDMLTYFSTCVGTDPFDKPLTDASTNMNSFMSSLNVLKDDCSSDNWTKLMGAGDGISKTLTAVNQQTDCKPLYEVYDTFVNKAICNNTFAGFYNVWLSVCCSSIMLFFLMIFTSVMWQYFGVSWKLRPDNVHTGNHMHLVGTNGNNQQPSEALALDIPSTGYKQEYTFTAASPTAPVLTRRDIEMI
jgi:hypothetical protein